jgi:peptidoglycan/xylan/chitin deacetylase (PgdA/CDA1 family)
MVIRLGEWSIKGIKQGLLYKKNFLSPFQRDKLRPTCAVVLQYHSIRPTHNLSSSYISPTLSITQDAFKRQVEFLVKHYDVMSLDQLLMHVQTGYTGHKMPVAITFDDGYRDNYLYAFPVLRTHNIPAMLYLTTECIGGGACLWTSELRYIILKNAKPNLRLNTLEEEYVLGSRNDRFKALHNIKTRLLALPRGMREEVLSELRHQAGVKDLTPLNGTMLNWNEVREMRKAGISFGAHTASHPSLPHIPLEEARKEILESKNVLESQLDEPIKHFSYPNPGDRINFNGELKGMLQSAGYNSATTSEPGYIKPGDDFFQLNRKGIYNLFSKLPDFYFWIEKEIILERWGHIPWIGQLSCRLLSGPA